MDGTSVYSSHDEFLRDLRKELESLSGLHLSEEYVKEAGENLRTFVSDLLKS